MKLFSDGTIYFKDGSSECIKCALASDNVVIVMAGSGTYKICKGQSPDYKFLQFSHDQLKTAAYEYGKFKWDDDLHIWSDYTYLDYVECREIEVFSMDTKSEIVHCKDYQFLETESENNTNKACLWEESDYKPCELQAIDCENCDYYAGVSGEIDS